MPLILTSPRHRPQDPKPEPIMMHAHLQMSRPYSNHSIVSPSSSRTLAWASSFSNIPTLKTNSRR